MSARSEILTDIYHARLECPTSIMLLGDMYRWAVEDVTIREMEILLRARATTVPF